MGWLDKIKATAAEASKVARDLTEAVTEEAEEAWGEREWYQEAKSIGQDVGALGKEAWEEGSELAGELADDFAQTSVGQKVGSASRHVVGFMAQVPVLSAAVDIMRARHGVDDLYALVQEEPEEPLHYIWLAEAMQRVGTDQKRYVAVRTAVDPSFIVTRTAIKAGTSLGAEVGDPVQIRLLKNAFALSMKRLRADPADSDAMHVLARVYLSQGDHGEAARFAKLAILAQPESGLPVITLSRTYQALGQSENAEKAAHIAIERGCSVGHEVLAELTLAGDEGTAGGRIEKYSQLRSMVSAEDRHAYWGPSVDGVDIVESVGTAQLKKTKGLLAKLSF